MEVQTPGQAFAAFLGALGFTRPVEQLELRSVPLPSLLFWLSRPKCSNLVEATIPAEEVKTTSACRSMAIAVSEEMLYKDRCPLVGVGRTGGIRKLAGGNPPNVHSRLRGE